VDWVGEDVDNEVRVDDSDERRQVLLRQIFELLKSELSVNVKKLYFFFIADSGDERVCPSAGPLQQFEISSTHKNCYL